MRNTLAIHFAVTFEPPAGAPPGREDDPSGSSKGNNLPPIQRPDSGPVVLDLPPGATPRIDLFVTVGVEGES